MAEEPIRDQLIQVLWMALFLGIFVLLGSLGLGWAFWYFVLGGPDMMDALYRS